MAERFFEKGVYTEFWVEFGPSSDGKFVSAVIYLGKEGTGFGEDPRPIAIFTSNRTAIYRDKPVPFPRNSNEMVNILAESLNWMAVSPQEGKTFKASRLRSLKIVSVQIFKVFSDPKQYIDTTEVYHINVGEPNSIDFNVKASNGRAVYNPDELSISATGQGIYQAPTQTKYTSTPSSPNSDTTTGKAIQKQNAERKLKALKQKADRITKGLHSFFEENGVDPNAPPEDTALPIQKKKFDILSNTEISDNPDESQNVEGAISTDTSNQAVIVFERFNPITRRNLEGLGEFDKTVKKEGGDGFIFISQNADAGDEEKEDILSYEEIVLLLEKAIKERNIKSKLINDSNIETLTDVANYLASDGYKSLVICTTTDKLGAYQNELTRKNSKPTDSGTFNMNPIEMRKIDLLDNSEVKDLSNSVLDGNFPVFLRHIGTSDIRLAKKIFLKMRKLAV